MAQCLYFCIWLVALRYQQAQKCCRVVDHLETPEWLCCLPALNIWTESEAVQITLSHAAFQTSIDYMTLDHVYDQVTISHAVQSVWSPTPLPSLHCASQAHSKSNPVSIVSVVAQTVFQEQRHQLFDSMSARVPECPTVSSLHTS